MYGIIQSALNLALAFMIKDIVLKGIFFVVWMYMFTQLIDFLVLMIPSAQSFEVVFNSLNQYPLLVYFLLVLRFDFGVSAVMAAVVTRFIIRRMPVVG